MVLNLEICRISNPRYPPPLSGSSKDDLNTADEMEQTYKKVGQAIGGEAKEKEEGDERKWVTKEQEQEAADAGNKALQKRKKELEAEGHRQDN